MIAPCQEPPDEPEAEEDESKPWDTWLVGDETKDLIKEIRRGDLVNGFPVAYSRGWDWTNARHQDHLRQVRQRHRPLVMVWTPRPNPWKWSRQKIPWWLKQVWREKQARGSCFLEEMMNEQVRNSWMGRALETSREKEGCRLEDGESEFGYSGYDPPCGHIGSNSDCGKCRMRAVEASADNYDAQLR